MQSVKWFWYKELMNTTYLNHHNYYNFTTKLKIGQSLPPILPITWPVLFTWEFKEVKQVEMSMIVVDFYLVCDFFYHFSQKYENHSLYVFSFCFVEVLRPSQQLWSSRDGQFTKPYFWLNGNTSTSCIYFCLNLRQPFLNQRKEEYDRKMTIEIISWSISKKGWEQPG